MEGPYIVYAKTDAENRITDINSSAFLSGTDGWTEIDRGYGDSYHHAHGNYLPKPIMDGRGIYCYRLVDGAVQERSGDGRGVRRAGRTRADGHRAAA